MNNGGRFWIHHYTMAWRVVSDLFLFLFFPPSVLSSLFGWKFSNQVYISVAISFAVPFVYSLPPTKPTLVGGFWIWSSNMSVLLSLGFFGSWCGSLFLNVFLTPPSMWILPPPLISFSVSRVRGRCYRVLSLFHTFYKIYVCIAQLNGEVSFELLLLLLLLLLQIIFSLSAPKIHFLDSHCIFRPREGGSCYILFATKMAIWMGIRTNYVYVYRYICRMVVRFLSWVDENKVCILLL